MDHSTIVAIATATGGAIGIIRLSGPDALVIADRVFRSAKGKTATSLIETDDVLPITLKDLFLQLDGIKDVRILNFGVEEE